MLNLTEQRQLEEAATPGNWLIDSQVDEYDGVSEHYVYFGNNQEDTTCMDGNLGLANATFIASARNHYRQLLNIVLATVKYFELKKIVYSTKSTIEDFNRMNDSEMKLFMLLKDVEIGDET